MYDDDCTLFCSIPSTAQVRIQAVIYLSWQPIYWYTSFGRGASKSFTQGGIFDLNMYITFDCAEIAAFWKHRWESPLRRFEQYQHCCSHFNFSNTHIVIPTLELKVIPWVFFSRSFLRRSLVQKLWCEVVFGFCCTTQYNLKSTTWELGVKLKMLPFLRRNSTFK